MESAQTLAATHTSLIPPRFHFGPATPETLMAEFVDGDTRAFDELFRVLAPRVASALMRMSGDRLLAEDLTQAVFLKLFRARGAYQRGGLITPWVFAMARNTFRDHLRHTRRRPELLSSDGSLPETAANDPQLEAPELRLLRDSLRMLPDTQREALLLLKVEGLTVAEAAALCGTTPASIKMRAHRAYTRLRALWAPQAQP